MTIGERIKKLRTDMGITQDELAVCAKTTKQTIHKYEVGIIQNIPASKIKLLADRLQTTPAYLMGWDGNAKINTSALPDVPSPSEVDPDQFVFDMYRQLDKEDKAEIRGEMKHMLKSNKYSKSNASYARIAAKGQGTQRKTITDKQRQAAFDALYNIDYNNSEID